MLIISLLILSFLYFCFNLSLIFLWLKMPFFNKSNPKELIFISVIIPVRNEEKNIRQLLEDLEKQTYPKSHFEVIVADDSSTDNTLQILKDFQQHTALSLLINPLQEKEQNTSPKKRAIQSSITLAKGEMIATTDGDCRVSEHWLENINAYHQANGSVLMSGAVTFLNTKTYSFFTNCQIIEFASLVGSGACAMYAQQPNMCNGANLSYLKSVFYEVDGFVGNENLASGDDEFLMHKIAAKYPEKVHFIKNDTSIVQTQAHDTFRSFFNQRKRWASKWKHYKNPLTIALAVFVFLVNLSFVLTLFLWLFGAMNTLELGLFLSLKCSAEFIFLALILNFLRKRNVFFMIPIVQFVYPFYVVFFGLLAQGKGYEWKDRKLS